ncbi:hypothetical protein [Ramlibacter tataouinensis]|nr:hypothetical protein [Ramlibacter tataouinensis]
MAALALGLGLALLALPPLVASAAPGLRSLGQALQLPASALLFASGLLLVLHLATRARPAEPQQQEESGMFGRDSTDFASRFDTRTPDGDTLAGFFAHRGGRAPARQWCPQVFQDIEWRRLEAVREALQALLAREAQPGAQPQDLGELDDDGLLALIARRTPGQQAELLRLAYEGEYWRPTCTSCGLKMVEHGPGRGGAGFWGCAASPRCRTTLPLRR